MAQTKILLDTNSYHRLAENLHPLLFVPYGDENFTLYAHKDLRDECLRQPRLALPTRSPRRLFPSSLRRPPAPRLPRGALNFQLWTRT